MKWLSLHEFRGVSGSFLRYYGSPMRQRRMRAFYSQFISAGDLCFDIGAHVGNRLPAWRAIGAHTVAFEPNQLLGKLLERLYAGKRVRVVRAGVGAEDTEREFRISSRTPTVSTFSQEWIDTVRADPRFDAIRWDKSEIVQMYTLDSLIERFGEPAFCKIDVEGFEADVLRGLSRPLAALSFEFIPVVRHQALECIDRMEALGDYSYRWSMVETMKWANGSWLDASAIKEAIGDMPSDGLSGDVYARRRS